MKKFVRLIAMLLALITVLGVAVSCANTGAPDETTDAGAGANTTAAVAETTVEETLYVPDDLEESYNFDQTITFFIWDDWRMMEFYSDETGDLIDDAIYHRNIAVQERLGVTFEWVEAPEDPTMISQGPSVCIFNKPDNGEVLASWLFMQYLLTNEVQIAYAQTEGYVPVTTKAQNSAEYVDYLSREGEDGELYYDVKLKATKLTLDYTEKTFVTPVFNGSASLRNAAGQLIEEVTKATRRGKTVDDAYIDSLYGEMISLYRLDGIGAGGGEKVELGPLPATAKALISAIAAAWVFIGIYLLSSAIKKRKNQGNT